MTRRTGGPDDDDDEGRTPGAGAEPQRLGEGLDRILKGLGAPPGGVLARLAGEWPDVVGPAVAEHSWVIGVEGDLLVVGVDESAYVTHLRYLDQAVRGWLDDVAGAGAIRGVDVAVRAR